MGTLPTGTVTFLFTDVEGRTRLWEQHPAAMRAAPARHDDMPAEQPDLAPRVVARVAYYVEVCEPRVEARGRTQPSKVVLGNDILHTSKTVGEQHCGGTLSHCGANLRAGVCATCFCPQHVPSKVCCGQVHVAQALACLAGTGLGVRPGVVATNRLIDFMCNLFLPLTVPSKVPAQAGR
jgi:hypothetical protein